MRHLHNHARSSAYIQHDNGHCLSFTLQADHLCLLGFVQKSEYWRLNWQTFPRVRYQKAILMYRIINNICPDYLKNYVSYTSDISCRDTRFTNCNQL